MEEMNDDLSPTSLAIREHDPLQEPGDASASALPKRGSAPLFRPASGRKIQHAIFEEDLRGLSSGTGESCVGDLNSYHGPLLERSSGRSGERYIRCRSQALPVKRCPRICPVYVPSLGDQCSDNKQKSCLADSPNQIAEC